MAERSLRAGRHFRRGRHSAARTGGHWAAFKQPLPSHALGRAAAFAGAGAQELRSLGVGEAVPEATVRLEIRAVAQALSQPRLRLVKARARARARARANAGLRIS